MFAKIFQKTMFISGTESLSVSGNIFLGQTEAPLMVKPFVDKNEPIKSAVIKKENSKSSAIIVDNNSIVTDSNLRKVIINEISPASPIYTIATNNLITIDEEDFLFNALLLMTKHNIKRLIVSSDNKLIGSIEQIDLLSYFSNHSYLISVKIEKAQNIQDLKEITNSLSDLTNLLFNKGLKARYIARIISELNKKIFSKVSEFIFDEEYKKNISLIVMGSEGRGEQIIRTDQDNGAVINDGFNYEMKKFENFSENLKILGFPECPGKVMVNNPFWTKKLSSFKQNIFEWCDTPNKESMMNLAILLDANVVWGDERYLNELKTYLFEHITDNATLLSNFASFIEQFELPVGIFGLKEDIDMKKIRFIIVHAARAFALENKIQKTSTVDRIKELNNLGIIDRQFASELIESFDIILTLTLKNRLNQINNQLPPSNIINIKNLTKIEKDMLKDSIKVINEFKKLTKHHFHLSVI
jgi:CBS domain-containing protein